MKGGMRTIWQAIPHLRVLENHDVGISKNAGTQQPWVFLLKMILVGCFGGTTI